MGWAKFIKPLFLVRSLRGLEDERCSAMPGASIMLKKNVSSEL